MRNYIQAPNNYYPKEYWVVFIEIVVVSRGQKFQMFLFTDTNIDINAVAMENMNIDINLVVVRGLTIDITNDSFFVIDVDVESNQTISLSGSKEISISLVAEEAL